MSNKLLNLIFTLLHSVKPVSFNVNKMKRLTTLLLLIVLTSSCKRINIQQLPEEPASTIHPKATERPSLFSKNWPYGSPSSFAERKALIDNGILYDGMTRAEAEAILGPPTGERNGCLFWYHNPGNRWHVAAYFSAELQDRKLINWQTGNR